MAKSVAQKPQQKVCHCALCAMAFSDLVGGKHQAYGCAAYIKDRKATVAYGSRHDGQVFCFAPELKGVEGEMCDECLDQLLCAGLAAVVGGGHYFGDEPLPNGGPDDLPWDSMRLSDRSQAALARLRALPALSANFSGGSPAASPLRPLRP